MPMMLTLGIFGAIALVIGVGVLIHKRSTAKKKDIMHAAAIEAGFEEIPDAKKNLTHWPGCGLSGGAKNITCAFRLAPHLPPDIAAHVQGDGDARDIVVLEHRYVVSTGQTAHVIHHRAAFTPVPQHWPSVRITRHNFMTRLLKRLGFRAMELDDERFNETWRVKTKRPEFAELLLTPQVQALLCECPRSGWWMLEGGALSLIEKGKLRPEDFPAMTAALRDAADAIPPELAMWESEMRM